MSNLTDLEIYNHPIFKNTNQSKIQDEKTLLTCNKICKHGENLFVAVENVVRWTKLVKGNTGFKTLKMPLIDFNIKLLLLNRQASILLIVGEKRLFACSLPVSFTDSNTQVRYKEIGAKYNQDRIIKVIFNPIARYDANVIVLRENKSVSAFDLSSSYDSPELSYDISTFGHHSAGYYNVSGIAKRIVSMDLGNDAVPNGVFTLFLLTEDGDIYTLCPWIPSQFLLTKSQIEDIYDSALINQYENHDGIRRQKQLQKQLMWATEIHAQTGLSSIETKKAGKNTSEEYHILKRPTRPNSVLQGPLLLQPYPETLYLELDGVAATDIQIINLGFLTAIFVAYSNGRIFTLLQDRAITTQWKKEDTESTESLVFFKSHRFSVKSTPNENSVKFLQSLNHIDDTVFIMINSEQILRLDCTSWSNELFQAFQQGVSSFNDTLKKLQPAKIHALKSMAPYKIEGVYMMKTKDKEEESLFIRTNGTTTLMPIPLTDKEKSMLKATEGVDVLTDKLSGLDLKYGYDSVLLRVSTDAMISENLDGELQLPKLFMDLTREITPTLENLEYFEALTNNYRKRMESLLKASLAMHRRVYLQRMELHQQVKKLQMIEKHAKMEKSSIELIKKEEKIRQKQEELEKRAKNLVEKLSQTKDIPLSKKEKEWSSDLKNYEGSIHGEDGLEATSDKLIKETSIVINELSRKTDENTKNQKMENLLSSDDRMAILQFLTKMDRHISQTQTKLQSILDRTNKIDKIKS